MEAASDCSTDDERPASPLGISRMPTTSPFETRTDEYDAWYDDHAGAYRAERAALEVALPDRESIEQSRAVEVGVGTGRFAAPLGVSIGVDPARNPLEYARERGVAPVRGVAEFLPIADESLDLVLFATTLCFVDDLEATLAECHRALRPGGTLVVGLLDRASPLGQSYQEHKSETPFYAAATFHSAEETVDALETAGFTVDGRWQTVFDDPAELEVGEPAAAANALEADVREGHGDGLFAVLRARTD